MAKSTVPVNFKDDIMNSAMNGKRRYRMINNSDGTISLEDVTTYDQVGSNFGAAQMNATNQAVNAAADASKIIDDIDAIRALTQEGYMAGALALKQVDDSLGEDENGMTIHEKLDYIMENGTSGGAKIVAVIPQPLVSNSEGVVRYPNWTIDTNYCSILDNTITYNGKLAEAHVYIIDSGAAAGVQVYVNNTKVFDSPNGNSYKKFTLNKGDTFKIEGKANDPHNFTVTACIING